MILIEEYNNLFKCTLIYTVELLLHVIFLMVGSSTFSQEFFFDFPFENTIRLSN